MCRFSECEVDRIKLLWFAGEYNGLGFAHSLRDVLEIVNASLFC